MRAALWDTLDGPPLDKRGKLHHVVYASSNGFTVIYMNLSTVYMGLFTQE